MTTNVWLGSRFARHKNGNAIELVSFFALVNEKIRYLHLPKEIIKSFRWSDNKVDYFTPYIKWYIHKWYGISIEIYQVKSKTVIDARRFIPHSNIKDRNVWIIIYVMKRQNKSALSKWPKYSSYLKTALFFTDHQ